jgi:hypothetical protein
VRYVTVGANYYADMAVGDETRRVRFSWSHNRDGDDWWDIPLDDVAWLLDGIESGTTTTSAVKDALAQIMAKFVERSSCCMLCEELVDTYQRALAAYSAAFDRDKQRARQMTATSHPWAVNLGLATVHLATCPNAPDLAIPHPGRTLHEFVHGGDGELDQPDPWHYTPRPRGQRMSDAELVAWIRDRRGPKGGANFRRCQRCQPAIPVAYTSAAGDVE